MTIGSKTLKALNVATWVKILNHHIEIWIERKFVCMTVYNQKLKINEAQNCAGKSGCTVRDNYSKIG